MKKILSITLSLLMVLTSISFTSTVFATNIPSTTITSVKAKSEAFTIKWKKKTNIAGYQIQYSANSNYVSKAPANIVEADRKKLLEEKEKLAILENK